MRITLENIFDLSTARIFSPDKYIPAKAVTIDSRQVCEGSIFVAIKGKRFDGHNFVNVAVKNGANAILINKRKLKEFDKINIPIITVNNTVKAYGELASMWRKKLNAKVISISGSNGKTTTKEMIATLLEEKFKVYKTLSNNNNQIGVPLTIFSTDSKCEVLVLEHGTNHFGEIAYTAKIARPDIALLTNIGDSHIEYLNDREGVLEEKLSLLDEAKANNGTAFLNIDDPLLRSVKNQFMNKITFGFKYNPDIKAKILGFTNSGNPEILITGLRKNIKTVPLVQGKSGSANYLAAVSVAIKMGLTKKQILDGTAKIKSIKGRLNIINYGNLTLIDDTYNSNPQSIREAFEVLKRNKQHESKIAVLGDMFELGSKGVEHHKELGIVVKKSRVNAVFTIGKLMKNLNDELLDSKIYHEHFNTRKSLKNFLNKIYLDNCVILVKGSRGMKMEEFAEIIIKRAA
ncbi:UDP-N-acetylmuramoyl-tripeptide--D-alanyl-D-alanine ligase [bacterium BMS3Abin04]|nr:UDP-N-acetylmuramoyl-tripeptide--D-alanyl-D-alanine ligase [bacterium BMS3Abin04]